MIEITRETDVTILLEPEELGIIFANMDEVDQAMFFQGVADASKEWTVSPCFQWSKLQSQLRFMPEAYEAFASMSEYRE